MKKGGAMVNDSHGRAAALLDSAGPGTSRTDRPSAPPPRLHHVRRGTVTPRADVYDSDDTVVVRVPLCEGPLELRVPRAAVKEPKRLPRDHIEGFNADATPC
jgi:hypothetical protein